MSGWAKNSAAFASVTLPPYWIGIVSAASSSISREDGADLRRNGLRVIG